MGLRQSHRQVRLLCWRWYLPWTGADHGPATGGAVLGIIRKCLGARHRSQLLQASLGATRLSGALRLLPDVDVTLDPLGLNDRSYAFARHGIPCTGTVKLTVSIVRIARSYCTIHRECHSSQCYDAARDCSQFARLSKAHYRERGCDCSDG